MDIVIRKERKDIEMTLHEFLISFGADESAIVVLEGQQAIKAVKQDGYALRYVRDQIEAICIAAVKQDGNALRYVRDQSEAICIAAVKKNAGALTYVDKRVFAGPSSRAASPGAGVG